MTPEDVKPAGAADEELRIYSAESEAVSPPVGIRPQLPSELPSNVSVEQLSRIDLIVSPSGTVESVKLVGNSTQRAPLHASERSQDVAVSAGVEGWRSSPVPKDGLDCASVAS